jgi:hypothetical protein
MTFYWLDSYLSRHLDSKARKLIEVNNQKGLIFIINSLVNKKGFGKQKFVQPTQKLPLT